jgi:pimeloyl-ACP methyl ester carboxylesterase
MCRARWQWWATHNIDDPYALLCCAAAVLLGVQVLCGMLDQLRVQGKVAVVGHDWGSAVAWAFALTQPDGVQRLAALSVGFPGRLAVVDTDRCTAAAAAPSPATCC